MSARQQCRQKPSRILRKSSMSWACAPGIRGRASLGERMAIISGTAGNDFIRRAGDGRVAPAEYNDTTGITTGDDVVNGLAGDDIIFGDSGNDVLNGGPGAAVLDGGPGNDALTGGPGPDTFVFAPGNRNDTISDFSAAAGDKIDLSTFAAD